MGFDAVAVSPAKFIREVRTEMGRVTWPSRKETLTTTALVLAMVAAAAAFFFGVDEVMSIAVRAIFGATGQG
jgi:preprotein translocase subunit SecE